MATEGEKSDAYLASARLMLRLVAMGDDEGDEADRLRDAMDAPWRAMTDEERAAVSALSAELRTRWGL